MPAPETRRAGRSRLTGVTRLSSNVGWNLAGFLLPTVVALAAIPLLVHRLGNQRFGILTLAWVLIGSFSLFDLGLGRALTQLVASTLGRDDEKAVATVALNGLLVMLVAGVLGGLLLALMAPWFVTSLLRIPTWLREESLDAFWVLALGVPLVLVSAGLRGILEAQQQFMYSNLVRIPLGALTFAGPLLVLPFTNSLVAVVLSLVFVRLLAAVAYLGFCQRAMGLLTQRRSVAWSHAAPVIRLGAWISVSNFISPLLAYVDRFVIGSILSVAAVAYYAVPFDVETRILVIPAAIAAVLFPAFATSYVRDRARTSTLFTRGAKYVFLLLFPITLTTVSLAASGLRLWLGTGFASQSTMVLQLLAIGVLCNGLAQVPFALIQGVGRADLTAKLHLVEAPIYLPTMWWMIMRFGIDGAAIAWTLRVVADMILLFAVSHRILSLGPALFTRMAGMLAAAGASLAIALLLSDRPAGVAFLIVVLGSFALFSWFFLLAVDERARVRRYLGSGLRLTLRRSAGDDQD